MRSLLAFTLALAATATLFAQQDDDPAIAARAEQLLRSRADEDVAEVVAWSQRIKLGDPHKYVLPIVAAKLHFDPDDKAAWDAYRAMIESDKEKAQGDRGLYHFSAILKTRIFFQYEKHLPPDVRAWFEENAGGHLGIFRLGGTENHGMMSRTSGYLFAERFQKGGSGDPKDDHKAYFTEFLRRECKKLYTIGMGEWDSSSYVSFTLTGWLNVRDFAQDEKMRDLASAAVDWYVTTYGLKYFHGVNSGPESRGFASGPLESNTDVAMWPWFDALPPGFKVDLAGDRTPRYGVGIALSPYRPDPIIRNIARKDVKLPFEVRASKPAYYGYTESNFSQEYQYYTAQFAMSTLYDPTPGNKTEKVIWPQTTMFKLAIRTPDDVVVVGAANGYHGHFPVEGRTPFDQYHQTKGAMVNICYVPDADDGGRVAKRSLLAIPDGLAQVGEKDGWLVFSAGETYIAARPLGSPAQWTDLADWARRVSDGKKPPKEAPGYRWLQTDGELCGWVIDTGTTARFPTAEDFMKELLAGDRLDLGEFAKDRVVTYRGLDGETLKMRHTGGPGGKPEAWTNGQPLFFEKWPVYESPYVREALDSGILEISDGREKLTIDFSGGWPVRRRDAVTLNAR